MEYLNEILQWLGTGTGLALVFMLVARFLPNNKLYGWGYSGGRWLSRLGNLKWGLSYEKIENIGIQSIGELLRGFKDGLDSDDADQLEK